jgi:hypothetical protein
MEKKMATKVGNRVKETSATTGTGTLDLAGAPTGFRGFGDEFTSGDSVYYVAVDDPDNPTEYEYGIGTFTSGTPDTLSRDTVEGSSNSGAKVSWTAGCTVVSAPTAAGLMGGMIGTSLITGQTEDTSPDTAADYLLSYDASATALKKVLISNLLALSSGATTGDVKATIKTTADTGWVMMDDGTIGDASSGGTTRANADTEDLFTLIWNNIANTDCAIQDSSGSASTRGADAATDYAAHKRMPLPKILGRALAASGAGSGLTSRALGHVVGEETHQLTATEMPSHTHTVAGHFVSRNYSINDTGITNLESGSSINTGSAGSDGAHNNMQPTSFLNFMIKL